MKDLIRSLYKWITKFLFNIKNWLDHTDEEPIDNVISSEVVRGELRLISKPLKGFIEEMNQLVKDGFVPIAESFRVTYNSHIGKETYHIMLKESAMGPA